MKKRSVFVLLVCLFSFFMVANVVFASEAVNSEGSGTEKKQGSSLKAEDTNRSFSREGGEAYEDLRERTEHETLSAIEELMEGDGQVFDKDYVKMIWMYTFYVYDVISGIYPGLFVFSITIGFIIAMLSTKNKRRRRFAVYFLCLGLPLVATGFVYGIPYLYLQFR